MDEFDLIARYFAPLSGQGGFALTDDAALLPSNDERIVVTTDVLVAGVHFFPADPPDLIARKALRVNLSDLAAKGATPFGYCLALGLPSNVDESWIAGFARGLGEDQQDYGVTLLGGDTTTTGGPLFVSITAFGHRGKRFVARSGAADGDTLLVTGTIGASTIGFDLLSERGRWDVPLHAARKAYRLPDPPVAAGEVVSGFATAAMDVSDGLIGDARKLARVSGVRLVIDADTVPLPFGLEAPKLDDGALVRLLSGGDDYQILFAAADADLDPLRKAFDAKGVRVSAIGAVEAGKSDVVVRRGPRAIAVGRGSWVHDIG